MHKEDLLTFTVPAAYQGKLGATLAPLVVSLPLP